MFSLDNEGILEVKLCNSVQLNTGKLLKEGEEIKDGKDGIIKRV